ncbi:MAG: hypothetical protein FJY92_06390 [Candidatus Hydrogenedentes bacterium]|nr:hypothetical protein [Candidatus Hydrogenedentota bacterium]
MILEPTIIDEILENNPQVDRDALDKGVALTDALRNSGFEPIAGPSYSPYTGRRVRVLGSPGQRYSSAFQRR